MKRITAAVLSAVLVMVLVITLGGCTKSIAERLVENAIENVAEQNGEDVDLNLEEGELNFTDEEGNEVNFGGAEIPEGWPASVPVNGDIEIQFSGSSTTDGKAAYNISGLYSGSGEDLYNYYKGELSSWNVESEGVIDGGEESGKTYTYQASDDSFIVSLFITEDDEEVSVVLSVTEK